MNLSLPPGGIVLGIGADLIEVERVRKVMERHPQRFLDRVYTAGEQAYCMQMKNPYPHLAARFAAKEAVSKAFTTGIGAELGWRSIEVIKGVREEPLIRLDEKGKLLLDEVGGHDVFITLSHTENYGHAVALLIRHVAKS